MLAKDLIDQALRDMQGNINEEINKLSNDVDLATGTSTLRFSYDLGGLRAGSTITIDNEMFRIWEVDANAKTAQAQRAFGNTSAASHVTDALVYVNPRIARTSAFNALNQDIADLSSPSNGLFRMASYEFTPTSDVSYDLTGATGLISGYEARQLEPALNSWRRLSDWRLIASQNISDYSSGYALDLPYSVPGWRVRFDYKAQFNQLTSMDDDIATVAGVPTEMQDILQLGVLARLGPMREIQRSFTESQGNARRADEVPPNAVTASYRPVMQKRQERINAEAARLMRLYPDRRA